MAKRHEQFFNGMLKDVERWIQDRKEDAYMAMAEMEMEGASAMHQRMDEAVTKWGSSRAAGLVSGPAGPSRPHAGRRETDQMYDAVDSHTDWVGPDTIKTEWGWMREFEDYYKYQEEGTDKILPMESLEISMFEAEEYLTKRLRGVK